MGEESRSRSEARFDAAGLRALALYSALGWLLFGVPLVGHFRGSYYGQGSDPSLFSWFFVWWPHAISHRLNPLFTHSVWAPAASTSRGLILIAGAYAWRRFREPLGRTLTDFFVIILVLSLGPRLRIARVPTIGLPFKAFLNLPLLKNVLPVRLMVYGFLVSALITALWLESARLRSGSKFAIGAAVVFFTLPTP